MSTDVLAPFTLPGGLLLEAPVAWERVDHPAADLCLRESVEAGEAHGFRSNLVVTSGAVDTGLIEWQMEVENQLDEVLDAYYLLDFDVVALAGEQGTYRLSTWSSDGVPVTLQQWSLLADGMAVCVTFTVATAAYDGLSDDLLALIGTLRRHDEGDHS